MVNLYLDLIHKSLKTLADVPVRWRGEVAVLLEAEHE